MVTFVSMENPQPHLPIPSAPKDSIVLTTLVESCPRRHVQQELTVLLEVRPLLLPAVLVLKDIIVRKVQVLPLFVQLEHIAVQVLELIKTLCVQVVNTLNR